MKTFLSFAFTLLLSISLHAQAKTNSSIEQQLRASGANATVHFDANSKVTTLKGVAENFSDSDTKRAGVKAMNFAVGALYAGSKIDRSIDPLTLSFWIMSGKPRFGDDQTLIAVSGNDRTDLGVGRYTARRDGMEYINFNLTRDQFAKLVEAPTFLIGGKQFTPTGSQRKLLRDILAATQAN
ncbi:MAG: hypothetical protein PSX80_06315 [bacterium]|nr:hypothetical protein [bacterium]